MVVNVLNYYSLEVTSRMKQYRSIKLQYKTNHLGRKMFSARYNFLSGLIYNRAT